MTAPTITSLTPTVFPAGAATSFAIVGTGIVQATVAVPGCAVVLGNKVTLKSLTSNVATLTTAAPHGYAVSDSLVVAGVDATFNGTVTITAVTSTTISYAVTHADVVQAAATGTAQVATKLSGTVTPYQGAAYTTPALTLTNGDASGTAIKATTVTAPAVNSGNGASYAGNVIPGDSGTHLAVASVSETTEAALNPWKATGPALPSPAAIPAYPTAAINPVATLNQGLQERQLKGEGLGDYVASLPIAYAGTTAYAVGDRIKPSGGAGYYIAKVGGTSAGSAPTWPTAVGGTVTDGTVTWYFLGSELRLGALLNPST